MYENTIDEIMQKDTKARELYLGSFAFDELPKINKFPSCLIINTQPRTKPGEHWLACYFDKYKNSYFFDSYGQSPLIYKLDTFLKNNSNNIYYNKSKIQGLQPYCGFYCIFFLLFIVRNKLDEFYKPFGKNLILNDNMIYKNVEKNN